MDKFEIVTHKETGVNPHGLCALSPNPKNDYLVMLSFKPGSLQVAFIRA